MFFALMAGPQPTKLLTIMELESILQGMRKPIVDVPSISSVLWQIARSVTDWGRYGLDFLAPPACPLCDQARPEGVPPQVCEACLVTLRPPSDNWCQVCGAPLGPYVDGSAACVHCRQDSFAFCGVVAAGAYDGLLRQHLLRGQQAAGEFVASGLAEWCWRSRREALEGLACEAIVTPPRHWRDDWWQHYDMPEVLANELSARLAIPYLSRAIAKRKYTRKQTSCSPTERRQQLRGAFAVRTARAIQGRRVLLVDDVLTTGGTAQAITRALLAAGAAQVSVCVVARGLGR